MRVLLLVNTSASAVTARTRVVIQKALSADHEVTVSETSRRGHATRLAQGAAADGLDAVVVLGGDGTLNEAANGLAGSSTALGVLPGGSTNVFARTIGMTNDAVEATGELLSAMAAGQRQRIGLGSVNGRYFLFNVGIGFDAAVVAQVEKRGALKRYAGHPLFVYAAFATWFRHYDRTRPRFALRAGDVLSVDGAGFAIVQNTNPYTYLGAIPLNTAPAAGLDTGLSVVAFRSIRFAVLIGAVGSALRSGRHLRRSRHIGTADDVGHIAVTGFGPFPYQVDGDYLGEVDALDFRHHPDCLDVFVPTPNPAVL
ncbi:MAG: diacylglycerol kinase family lipid kinase [Actinomycetota bacterium]|nr:diacylglycerol kinase family lipid kinase [Actinomycetota bacterium]